MTFFLLDLLVTQSINRLTTPSVMTFTTIGADTFCLRSTQTLGLRIRLASTLLFARTVALMSFQLFFQGSLWLSDPFCCAATQDQKLEFHSTLSLLLRLMAPGTLWIGGYHSFAIFDTKNSGQFRHSPTLVMPFKTMVCIMACSEHEGSGFRFFEEWRPRFWRYDPRDDWLLLLCLK
jgi:hypothetical protein